MEIKKHLSDHDLITLLALSSRVCLETVKVEATDPILQKQLDLLRKHASKMLARIDQIAPSIIPTPPDGKPWASR